MSSTQKLVVLLLLILPLGIMPPDVILDYFSALASVPEHVLTPPIKGKYVNNDMRFEVTFPEGWTGFSSPLPDNDTVYLSLAKDSDSPELSADSLSTIAISAGKDLTSLNIRLKNNPLYENCKTILSSIEVINGENFAISSFHCPTVYYETYYMHNDRLTLNMTFSALPAAFEADVADFQASARTIRTW